MLNIEGHAITSTDGMIADAEGEYPASLRNDADWRQYQAALDEAILVVLGRQAHERHPNPGRRRLVLTRSVEGLSRTADDPLATFWNPSCMAFSEALLKLGVTQGTVAITGVFDLFLPLYTRFMLSERHTLSLPGGISCFSAGHPRSVLSKAGLHPATVEIIDSTAMVTTTIWQSQR